MAEKQAGFSLQIMESHFVFCIVFFINKKNKKE